MDSSTLSVDVRDSDWTAQWLAKNRLGVNVYQCSDRGEVKKPFRIRSPHVYAAMAHRDTEVAVPIRPMKCITLVEIHRIRNAGQVIPGTRHSGGVELCVHAELASYCRMNCSPG